MKVDVIQECDRTHCQNIIAWFTALHQSLSVTDSLLPLLRFCLPDCHHRPTFSVRVYDLCLYGFLIRINELCLSSEFSTAEYHLLMCNLLNCTVLGSLGRSCGNENSTTFGNRQLTTPISGIWELCSRAILLCLVNLAQTLLLQIQFRSHDPSVRSTEADLRLAGRRMEGVSTNSKCESVQPHFLSLASFLTLGPP